MSITRTRWLKADIAYAEKCYTEFQIILEGKSRENSKHHETLEELTDVFVKLKSMAEIPLENFIEVDANGEPKFDEMKGIKTPRVISELSAEKITLLITTLRQQIISIFTVSRKLERNNQAIQCIVALVAFTAEVKKDYEHAVERAKAHVVKCEENASQKAEHAKLRVQIEQLETRNIQLQKQKTQRIIHQPEQVAPPVKKTWWKYALAALGIMVGIGLLGTGVAALLGVQVLAISIGSLVGTAMAVSGGGLLIGSTAYMGKSLHDDNLAEKQYQRAVLKNKRSVELLRMQIDLPPVYGRSLSKKNSHEAIIQDEIKPVEEKAVSLARSPYAFHRHQPVILGGDKNSRPSLVRKIFGCCIR